MLGGSFGVAFQWFIFWCHSQQLGRTEPRCQALFSFPSAGRREAWTWHYFLTLLKPQPVLANKHLARVGTKWKWTGPDQSNACLQHYCAVLISWGSTWTLAIDCNPLGKEKYCIWQNKMLLHGVHRVYKEQSPDASNCCAICLYKLPFLQ